MLHTACEGDKVLQIPGSICTMGDASHKKLSENTLSSRVEMGVGLCSIFAHLAVHAAGLRLQLCIVELNDEQRGKHAHSSTAKGRHNGIHLSQLRWQMHGPDELLVRCACMRSNTL